MQMLNKAVEDADAFMKMMGRLERPAPPTQRVAASREVADWNAEVDRKRAEKKARKLTTLNVK